MKKIKSNLIEKKKTPIKKNVTLDININFKNKTEKMNFLKIDKIEIFLNNFLKKKLNNNKKRNEKKIKNEIIGCGAWHSFIFNKKENKLFLFGDNEYYQLGLNKIIKNLNSISNNIIKNYDLNFSKIKKFEIGGNHNLILFENNDLFSFGDNYYSGIGGQCGINNQNKENKKILIPKKIEFPCWIEKGSIFKKQRKIKNIFCSHHNSFILLSFFFFLFFFYFFFKKITFNFNFFKKRK